MITLRLTQTTDLDLGQILNGAYENVRPGREGSMAGSKGQIGRICNMDNMELWLHKAQVLIEALPYIQHFNGAKIVVKYGGSAMS